MTGKSHLFFGIGTGILSAIVSPAISLFHIPVIAAASLLPDIDSTSSRIGRKIKLIGKLFGHRGFFHTPFFLMLLYFIPYEGIRRSFIIGVISHLFLDLMNRGGIMLLWPLSPKKFRIANLKCGMWGESLIVFLLLIIEIVMIILYYMLHTSHIIFLQ